MRTIPTLWPGHIVRPGSASRDDCMQCDSCSHLLRVRQDGGCCGPVTHGQVHLLGFFSCSQDAQCLIVSEIKFSSSKQGKRGTRDPGRVEQGQRCHWEARVCGASAASGGDLGPERRRPAEKTWEKLKKVGSVVRPPAGPSATCSGAAEQLCYCRYTHSLVSWRHTHTHTLCCLVSNYGTKVLEATDGAAVLRSGARILL